MVINITDQTMVDENYIEIKFTKGYMSTEPKGRLSKDEAIKLIQEDINHITVKDQLGYGKSVYRLIELYIEDAFDKMGVQAFVAFDKAGQINNYLICKGSICRAPFLDETLVVDIDKDGAYELLNTCGWGSGIYRIEFTAYKFSSPPESSSRIRALHPAYYNCYIPKKGYAQLMLVKVSDTEVKLFGADRFKGELVPITDYGFLKIDGYRLYTDAPGFPFHEWENGGI